MVQLIFWDKRQININNWLWEERKKMNSVKYLNSLFWISHSEQMKRYNELIKDIKTTRDKYTKSLMKIQADWILEDVIMDYMIKKAEYFDEYYSAVINNKREEYIKKMKKKLKTEREILPPF